MVTTRSTLHTQEMILNMGPHHPSTHGVLRLILRLDGEVVEGVIPDVGYLHRGIEKIGEGLTYRQFIPYTDRIEYLASMNMNHLYCMAVEKLAGIEVPERAEYIRVIMAELNRIISHIIGCGALAMDLGAFTPFLYGVVEREKCNDLMEMTCGQRLTYNYLRIGGVSQDLPQGFEEKTEKFLNEIKDRWDEINKLISANEIFIQRLANVAVLSVEDAFSYNITGPNLRACGVDWDLRRDEPYSVYDRFDFQVPVGRGERGAVGDCYNRYMIRVREVYESIKIVHQALNRIPVGDVMAKVSKLFKPPAGEVFMRAENPRGEMAVFIESDGSDKPYRIKFKAPSFNALAAFNKICRGHMVSDLAAVIGSFDIVMPEVDR
ncbi:MAG: NADH-quinone oxidoreductase subunit NuoD [Nitrospirae bacterium CG08_land_8_20_14_0_20_52_24]|nr:MAG: NADH-quinone oxidoreductase subunit NuoD [Nitrospirae bacterium CG08_land_8_20_14_0_20_52_24]PIW84577.1 MAG: NADH-quinone oxidoreductase subunit NuoD [Nitrospirae bacterium CG_4_8_14_3_um_filter_50_41]PIX84702.1 MAG: NADH-quinone oxidoreductase subunit NuoD [Nitrospirae bacterium CG_4_10_14_3_um_filter_53_41]